MMESDLELNLNLSYAQKSTKRQKNKRFYGNKNYRNPTRAKYLGRKTKKIISTSSVKMNARPQKKQTTDSSKIDDPESTALHFKAFDTVPKVRPSRKKVRVTNISSKKRESASKPEIVGDDVKVPTTTTKKIPHGPWKSSLFNQNPEIPKVSQVEVMKISEEVFSCKKFSDLALHPHLLSCIKEKFNLVNMTSIQQHAIPVILSQKDALIKSQTGSGKTHAYAIPTIQMLQEIRPEVTREDGPVALVLTPTRELALQSYDIFVKLTRPFCRIVPTWIIGGENRNSEKARIRKGVNIVIGTPGRILDHIQTTKNFNLKNLRYLILDEADRLLDMGFQMQIQLILNGIKDQCQQKIQSILLSATLTEKVENLASLALDSPARVHVANSNMDQSVSDDDAEETFALPDNLKQHVIVIPSKLRLVCLATFLKSKLSVDNSIKIIVFLSCRDSVEFHYNLFKRIMRHPKSDLGFDIPCDVEVDEIEFEEAKLYELHGGMTQNERQEVFRNFSSLDSGVLLTTDVAARGLDLPSVSWVIQYTSPGSPVDYIHRVGRTARAGKKGNALLMLTPAEVKYVKLLTQYNIAVKEMNVDDVLTMGKGINNKVRKNPQLWQMVTEQSKSDATALQNRIEYLVSKTTKIKTLARTAYMSYIRAYASYPAELKSIFHVKSLHLGHVAKSFGLQDAPKDIVKTLEKSVSHLAVKTSFEYRETKAQTDAKEGTDGKPDDKPRFSRKQIMKRKMSRKPDLMSEFSSGLGSAAAPSKRAKL